MSADILTGLVFFIIGTIAAIIATSQVARHEKRETFWSWEIGGVIAGIAAGLTVRFGGNVLWLAIILVAIFVLIALVMRANGLDIAPFVVLLILSAAVPTGLYAISSWISASIPPDTITFAGKVVNPVTGAWNNDRLVIIYKNNEEIGRTQSAQGEYKDNGLGIIDGLFILEVPNEYRLTSKDLKGFKFKHVPEDIWKSRMTAYHWFPEIFEGKTLSTHVDSKNVDYIIQVLDGDISTLPYEIVNGKTELRGGQIVVAAPQTDTGAGVQSSNDIIVQNIQYATNQQVIDVNMVLPINVLNNCDGTSDVSQKYTQTQTFIHQYSGEVGASIGLEIPIGVWGKILPSLQAKYGFEDGQVDTISIEYNTAAAPGSSVAYVVTLKEVWESGVADVTEGTTTRQVPFRVKTNLIYEISSQPRSCP